MLVVYDSRTGNVEKFVRKLGVKTMRLQDCERIDLSEPFVMVTYTTGFGNAPANVISFLERNRVYLKGVSASGNRNWGTSFAKSADTIAELFEVPIVHKFELSGTTSDVERFQEGMRRVAAY
ncbi:MAG: ribonucleotide reductase stimulatory protein [Paenibacillus sp.]|nr:ribonucleotide reductase stimulatory protein [Paenibacillus sp.]